MKVSRNPYPQELVGDERWELVRRIMQSRQFASSARLRDFLTHVTACALLGAPEEATEQQVGIRVFQRQPGFNTGEDSIVRSHARLLRLKLTAYFAEGGAAEETVLDIPKGGYLPVFTKRVARLRNGSVNGVRPASADGSEQFHARKSNQNPIECSCVQPCAFSLTPTQTCSASHVHQLSGPSGARCERPVDLLWGPFFSSPKSMVIYSNAPFITAKDSGLRYADSGHESNSGQLPIDHYTGIGEVQSVFHITRLFERRGMNFGLKRSSLVTWDDAKHRNLIFLGSAAENMALRVLPQARHFSLAPGAASIVNHQPQADEPDTYQRASDPIARDYAIIALWPGLLPGRNAIVFAGLTTLGTQAAVEYACDAEAVAELLPHVIQGGVVRPFEAVVEASIAGGVPLGAHLVAIRVHSTGS